MSRAYAEAERTPWLGGARIRAYDALALVLFFLVAMITALPLGLAAPESFVLPAIALFVFGFAGALVLRRRALRSLRLNNGGVALMVRGEDAAAAAEFRRATSGRFARDVVAMSLHNLGVLALRALDLPSAVALQRAALAASNSLRFPWQPNFGGELARTQLAFALAACGQARDLDEASALVEGEGSTPLVSPLAIAFAARARALVASRRDRFEAAVRILDEEHALLRNVLPLNDSVLCDALLAHALARLGRPHSPVLADDAARAYVTRIFPAAAEVLVG